MPVTLALRPTWLTWLRRTFFRHHRVTARSEWNRFRWYRRMIGGHWVEYGPWSSKGWWAPRPVHYRDAEGTCAKFSFASGLDILGCETWPYEKDG